MQGDDKFVNAAGGTTVGHQDLRRHPGDALRVACGGIVFLAAAWLARQGRVGTDEEALLRLVNRLPAVIEPAMVAVMQAGTLAAVGVATVVAWGCRRRRLSVDLLVGGGVTWLAVKVVQLWVARTRPADLMADVVVRGTAQVGFGFPSGHAALAATLATVAGPWLPRPWRRAIWVVVGVVALARMYVGAHLPYDVVGGAAFGWMVGAIVHLVRGAPGNLPDAGMVAEALALLRLHVVACAPLSADARGSTPFTATTDDGRRWFVKIVGAEQRDADLLFKLYRFLVYRDLEDERPFASPKQMVEHEAYVALLAARYGVRVPDVAGAVEAPDGSGALVQPLVDGVSADGLSADALAGQALESMWRQIATLHVHQIAHRDVRLANWLIAADGTATLTDFGYAENAASDRRLVQDVAELLVATSAVVGPQRAVAAAHEVLGTVPVADALPLLQPMALSSITRAAARTDGLLDKVRTAVAALTDLPAPEPLQMVRVHIRPGVIAGLVALAFAVHLLLPQVGELGRTITTLRTARWNWLLAASVFATLRFVASAVALMGASAIVLPLGRTTLVQLAGSAAGKLAPAGLGGLGITERYLERAGAARSAAVTAVALDTLAGFIAHVALLAGAAVLVGDDPWGHLRVPHGSALLAALAALAAIVGVALRMPWGRRHIAVPAAQAWAQLRAALASPTRALTLLGGSAGLTLTMISCLFTSIHAFTPTVGMGTIALAYLVGSAIGSAAPTPGGLGVTEAALVAALVGLGMPTAPAVAGVLTFRLLTFWLPTAPGGIALRWLHAAGAL